MNQINKHKKIAMYASVFASVLVVLRIIAITTIIGDEGSGFYAAAYEIYSIAFIISSFCFTQTVGKMVAARLSRGQVRNARKVFISSILLCTIVGLLICLLLEVSSGFLLNSFLLQGKSIFALKWLAPTLLFVGISGCIRGYLKGIGSIILVAISQVSEQIIIWILSIIGAKYFFNYGIKVGTLLKDNSYGAAYGAAGSMLGISVGSLVTLIILVIVYRSKRSRINKMIAKDGTIKDESYSQVFRVLFVSTIPIILSSVLFSIHTLIDQRIFNQAMIVTKYAGSSALQFGIFYGKFRVMILFSIILFTEYQSLVAPTLHKMINSGDQRLAKDYIRDKMISNLRLSIPLAVGIVIIANPLISVLYKGNVTTAVTLLQSGSILIVLYSIISIFSGVLQGLNKQLLFSVNLFVSLLVNIFCLIFMLYKLNMNIEAVVYSWIVFATLVVILNAYVISKYLKYRQEWKISFIIPGIAAAIMGLCMYFTVRLLGVQLGNTGVILLSIVLGMVIYWISLIALKGISQRELVGVPGGKIILFIAKLIRIM